MDIWFWPCYGSMNDPLVQRRYRIQNKVEQRSNKNAEWSIRQKNNNNTNKKENFSRYSRKYIDIWGRRLRRRWEDNIKMDLSEVGCDPRDWIVLGEDKDQWWGYIREVMNLRVP